MALFLATCCLSSNAQTLDSTGNLIDNGQWTGIGARAPDPNDCCSNPGGSQPLYDTNTDTIKFSYGQATVGQIIGINSALSGSGIQVNGYTWGYDARNMNGSGGQNGTDTLTSYSYMKDAQGNTILDNTIVHNTQFEWTRFTGTRTLSNPYALADTGTIGIQFSGKDGGFWAGLYGPEIRNVTLSLNYTSGADPCVEDPLSSISCPGYAEAYKSQQCSINPLYDQTCPGYAQAYFDQQCSFNPLYNTACPGNSAVIATGNLVPHPGSNSGWFGGILNNSFAINTALSHSGAGIMIHGFQWGYRAVNLDGFLIPLGSSTVNVNIRNGDGTSLYAWSRNNTARGYNSYSSSYVLPQSQNNLSLGTFEFTAQSSGFGLVDTMWARALITPDSCTLDPLSSILCTGYQDALLAQQCSLNTLYSPSCPGYQEAFAALLASAIPETTEAVSAEDPVLVSAATISSSPATTEDPTKDQTAVTTDVGGAELSATGEIIVSDGIPSDVKESAKESVASTEKKEDTKSAESATASSPAADKKKSKVNAVALAQAAAREAEKTALTVAGEAQASSLSENANPEDGLGLAGTGISVPGLSLSQSTGNTTGTIAIDQHIMSSVSIRSRQESNRDDTQAVDYSLTKNDDTNATDIAATGIPVEIKEPASPTGPSVRRGGSIDGMSGGDINALVSAPADFNDYLARQLQDAQFYATKEIYRNQKNVDNARALRGLGTDRLHQEMIDQQYNISEQ